MTAGRGPTATGMDAAQVRCVLDSIPARIALLDRRRRHRYVNQEYAAFVGKPAPEILGRTVAQVIGAAAYARVRQYGTRALAGETVRWEGWLPYRSGSRKEPRFVQRVYVPYRPGEGAPEGYFVFARDLTELKRSEQRLAEQLDELRASEAVSASVIGAALDCVVVIDELGAVVTFNPAAEQTFGYSQASVLGKPIADLIVPPALRGQHAAGFQRYLRTGQARMLGHRVEIEAMRADGSLFPVELSITEVRLPERRLFTAYMRDLTQAKATARELERQQHALRQAEKMAALGSLLAGVAHELNNPLSIVIGNALMLEEEVQESSAPGLAPRTARVRDAAERCARVVRDFLAAARAGKTREQALAPRQLVRSVLDSFGERLRTGGIELQCDLAEDLPEVFGDGDQLRLVLANLVLNAQHALENTMSSRQLAVAARRIGAGIEISVTDNGPGVPEQVGDRIFEPFFTTKPAGAGMGLGLAISRHVVEAHGGSLHLVASPAGGARFVVWLPPMAGRVAPDQPSPPACRVPTAPAPT